MQLLAAKSNSLVVFDKEVEDICNVETGVLLVSVERLENKAVTVARLVPDSLLRYIENLPVRRRVRNHFDMVFVNFADGSVLQK